MTTELTIQAADNGIMVIGEEWARVIENTHGEKYDRMYDNIIQELGELLHDWIDETMDEERTTNVKVKIEITKMEDK